MKSIIIAALSLWVINLQSQMISTSDYSKMLLLRDQYPANIIKRLEVEGFEFMYRSDELAVIDLNYALKKNDPYFFNVMVIQRGAHRTIHLTFHEAIGEYNKLEENILKTMTKQPKTKYGDYRVTIYKSSNCIYFGIFKADASDKSPTKMITIMNYDAYKNFYLTPLDER